MLEIVNKSTEELIPYVNNARTHSDEQINQIAGSIKEFGFNNPILLDGENGVVAGHGRLLAAKKLGLKEVPCIELAHLTEAKKRAYILADNKIALNSGWDNDILNVEIEELKEENIDLNLIGFSDKELDEIAKEITKEEQKTFTDEEADEIPEEIETRSKPGDLWKLGNHRLMCGDSTDEECVKKLMGEELADMVFTDPPYGMKKESDGVLNDNLNFDDLLEFNKKWISLSFDFTKDNGSWYCWGIDEVLMDIYSNILKPLIKKQKVTFRNLITWDKNIGQGQKSKDFRMFPIVDEKCLFVMCGVQGFSNNADNYFEKWEPIRKYLKEQRDLMSWSNGDMKKMLGHSVSSGCHWFDKSQWSLPTEEEYKTWQKEANGKAFKKEYEEIKKEYDSTRAYFDNTHDNMNNVWHFERTSQKEREEAGGHATPKPIALCSRAIKSSSRENELVLDLFGGSGSTLIACEKLNRRCCMMELSPKYSDVIIQRWENLTGKKAELING
jgi:DNA modification methylase